MSNTVSEVDTLKNWLRRKGYRWKGDEEFYKGFYSESRAEEIISVHVDEGRLEKING